MGSGNNKPIQTQDDNRESFSILQLDGNFNTIEDDHHTHDDNLETFSLLWLDGKVNITEEYGFAQLKLRQTINHLKTFDNRQQCYQHILSFSPQERLVLLVSNRYGRQLIPKIHDLRQVSSIYICCMDKEGNEQWAKDFTKVKAVTARLDDLINLIEVHQKSREKIEEPLSMNISTVAKNPHEPTHGFNSRFIHSLLLIDALVRMKSSDNDRQKLIALCQNEYKNNSTQLALIDEFDNEYTSKKAVWWYTRDSFLNRMLNKALRIQNIDLLVLFRFVIADVYQQLEEHQYLCPLHVYRSQVISDDELNTFQHSIGEFISINSFLSTSTNHPAMLGLLRDFNISNDLHRVLFEINADPDVVTSRPFAYISDSEDEENVLFMAGSVFRLVDIHRDEDEQLWVIRMKLCSDDEYGLKELTDHLKKEYGAGDDEVDLRFFGDVLYQMGKYDLAETMYCRLLDELPANDPALPQLYRSFGILKRTKAEYDFSLQWFRKALSIQGQKNSSNHANIGDLYKWIGTVYSDQGDNDEALEYYSKAVEFFHKAPDGNDLDIAHIYHNIGIIYKQDEKYQEALEFYQNSLTIKKKCLPPDHPSIAISYNNIGNVYLALGQYDLAMEYHELSLNVRLKSLPFQHPDIAMSYRNIGVVYESMRDWEQALIYYEKAATIYRHSFPSQDPHVIRIESDIQRMS